MKSSKQRIEKIAEIEKLYEFEKWGERFQRTAKT